jgi:RimJ/RimL family protein N-acetyltransferase
MGNDSFLRCFYDIMVECGMGPPPLEQWLELATNNAELWPIMAPLPEGAASQPGMPPGRLMIGGVIFKGHTVHIAVRPEWRGRWIRPSMLKAWRTRYEHHCDLYATPDASNKAACELAERLGFRRQGSAGQSVIYVKERTTCPQS